MFARWKSNTQIKADSQAGHSELCLIWEEGKVWSLMALPLFSTACYGKNFGPKGFGYGLGAGALAHTQ